MCRRSSIRWSASAKREAHVLMSPVRYLTFLAGCFGPMKEWARIVVSKGSLVAAICADRTGTVRAYTELLGRVRYQRRAAVHAPATVRRGG